MVRGHSVARDIALGLSYLHDTLKVLHLDIKVRLQLQLPMYIRCRRFRACTPCRAPMCC